MHAVHVWAKETFSGRRDPLEVVKAGIKDVTSEKGIFNRVKTGVEHTVRGFQFLYQMDLADRAVNGLQLLMEWDQRNPQTKGPFGKLQREAYEHPALSDHNFPHNRRYERWLESLLLNIGELRHSQSVLPWIDSMFVFGKFHDIDQLVSLYRNMVGRENGEQKVLNAKKGHGIGAAVMVLVTHRRYGIERMVDNGKAWKISAGAAYMMMKHDEPEKLPQLLAATEKAYVEHNGNKVWLHGVDLVKKFEDNELDLTTLSPYQMMEILVIQKGMAGFIEGLLPDIFVTETSGQRKLAHKAADITNKAEVNRKVALYMRYASQELLDLFNKDKPLVKSIFGLAPEFEYEYAEALLTLLARDDTAHIPILNALTDAEKTALKRATEVAIRADTLEMVAPPVEAIYRSLSTQFSLGRPFWRDGLTLDQVINSEGNLPLDIDSDTRRKLKEFVQMGQIGQSLIEDNPYNRRLNRDNAVMGLLYFRTIGEQIMRADYGTLDASFAGRMAGLSKKALRKAGYTPLSRELITAGMSNFSDYQRIEALIRSRGETELADKYGAKILELQREAVRFKWLLTKRQPPNDEQALLDDLPSPSFYTEAQISSFLELCDQAAKELCGVFGLSPREFKRYKRKVWQGKYPSTIPYDQYDSVASMGRIRTILEPLEVVYMRETGVEN